VIFGSKICWIISTKKQFEVLAQEFDMNWMVYTNFKFSNKCNELCLIF
jgi:hypothetical protein